MNYERTKHEIPGISRTYALAPLTPQVWGEQDLTPPRFGGLGGLIGGYCVSPDQKT